MTKRTVGLLLHNDRASVARVCAELCSELERFGVTAVEVSLEAPLDPTIELLVVLGGDGTILRAAEMVHGRNLPILGVNMGRVGFLAEAEPTDLGHVAEQIAVGDWRLEHRITLDLQIVRNGSIHGTSFALNEIAIEKSDHAMMTEVRVEIDGTAVMAWPGDGLIASTPTGSTAYAFSAGGPVVWPTADVIELVPISAHALFARPLVLSPESEVAIEILAGPAIATCDGRREFDLVEGDVLRVLRGTERVSFARLHATSFTDRLVKKFHLPTQSWRVQRDSDA